MNQLKNHEIPLQQAMEMTALYRGHRPSNFPISEMFSKAAIRKLLAAGGCAYMRIYLGMTEDLQVTAILVAANADGEDMLPASAATGKTSTEPVILEDGYRCPDDCPKSSMLNGS